MDCDRLKKIEELIYSASTKKDVNQYISIYINYVISFTWDLGNLREEICLCRDYLKFLSEYILLGDKKRIFNLLDNTTLFYDLVIEDFARWTIKKEILKLLNNCIRRLNTADINRISNEIYIDNSKFYIHKLIDILSIYGDYDFQALVLEVIFRTSNRHELRALSKQLIPESEKLRKKFLKIDIKTFDETARDFLNSFNERSNHIFSICCENVTLGSIHCGQKWDKHKGVWVDFNLVDGAISWYVTLNSFKIEDTMQNSQHNIWNLVTLFKDDVHKITIKRFKKTVEVKIELNKSVLSFHKEYQHVIDNELNVCLELAHSAKTHDLICNVLESMYGKMAVQNSKLQKTDEIVQLNMSKNNHKISQKRKKSFKEPEHIFLSNSSSISNCLVCLEERSIPESCQSKEVLMGTQTAQKLKEYWPPTIHRGSSTFFEDKKVSKDTHQKESVVGIELEADLWNGRFKEESDIDNMSVHFASEEQLLRMASDFDNVISLINKGQIKTGRSNSTISSTSKNCISQYFKNKNKRRCTDVTPSNSKNSKLKHMEIFESTSNSSREKSVVSVSDIFKYSIQEKSNKESFDNENSTLNTVVDSKNEVEVNLNLHKRSGDVSKCTTNSQLDKSKKGHKYSTQEKSNKESSGFDNENSTLNTVGVSKNEVEVDLKLHKRTGNVSKCTTNSQLDKLKKSHKSISVNKKTNASSLENKNKLIKRRNHSKKEKLNTKADKIFNIKNISRKNYNIDIEDSVIKASICNLFGNEIENSRVLESFMKKCTRKSLKKENRRRHMSMSIDKIRGEEEVTDESVCSIPHFLNIAEIPVTPPPFLESNSEHSSSSSIVRKVKKIHPLPITPLSELNHKDNIEDKSHNSHMIVREKDGNSKVDLQKCEEKFGMNQHLVDIANVKDNKSAKFPSEAEVLEKNKSVEKEHIIASSEDNSTGSPIWTRKGYIRLQSLSLHSKDFLGFYYFIVFYHYDIFAKDMEPSQEILIFNNRLQEMNNSNTKILLCYLGNIKHFLEKAITNKEYQNLQLPIIEDDGSFISLFLKHDLKNFCAKKSYILVDDNGFVILKHMVTVEYAINFDLLLHITSKFQKIRNPSHSGD